MATVIFIKESKQTPSAMRGCINYCVQEKKTVDSDGRQYVGGVNCLGRHAYEEFMATKNLYGKACGTYFYQYVQSFAPGEIQSYEEAHRIGLEFAGKSFPGYEVLVAAFGFQRKNIYVANYFDPTPFFDLDIDVIYISGGNTFGTMKLIRDSGFDKAIID